MKVSSLKGFLSDKAIDTIASFGGQVSIEEKAFFLFLHEVDASQAFIFHGESRSKANYKAFKEYGDGESLLEFCQRVKLGRWKHNDLYALHVDFPELSELAERLLVVNEKKNRASETSVLVTEKGFDSRLDDAIIELQNLGMLEDPVKLGPFLRYNLSQEGCLIRASLLSKKYYPFSDSDLNDSLDVTLRAFKSDMVSLCEIKNLKSILGEEKFSALNNRKCFIYSWEWGMWWSGTSGYTNKKEKRALFSLGEAFFSSGHCCPRKGIHYFFKGDS